MKSPLNTSTIASAAISLMSAPAAKAFSEPVSTMHPMPSSASKAFERREQLVHQLRVERVQRLAAG